MKAKFLFIPFFALSLGVAPFAYSQANHAQMAVQNIAVKKDGEIIATLMTLNKGEIAAATVALKKTSDPAVKDYAQMLMKDHTANLKQTIQMSHQLHLPPVDTKMVKNLQADTKKQLKTLKGLNGQAFDKMFIGDMVTDHQNALNIIDNTMLVNVNNIALKKQVEATRVHIAHHLEVAQEIQKKMA